jgi:lipopolysaccharide/colanic/teichoic acid biosynthesis glycosyltransferase
MTAEGKFSHEEAPGLAAAAPTPSGRDSLGYAPWKAAVEYVLAVLLIALAGPLILAAMAVVKLTSPGPAIYRQTRLGRLGRPYTIYKIRTMVVDSERGTGPRWATRDDPRITPIGWYLRRFHMDELPQLLNVIRGEMGLVGPRPERPEFVAQLERAVPRYRDRLLIRPGLTGLAQVQLPPDADLESVRRKLACDLYYIRQMGPWLDLRILISTASYLVGIPFHVPRSILRVPSGELVEGAYRSLAEAEAPSQMQPA